jgi:cytochrome c
MLLIVACLLCAGAAACTEEKPAPRGGAGAAPTATAGPGPADVAARTASLPAAYRSGDYENGRRVFAQCRSCHTLAAGAPNRVGPRLHGVFGRSAAGVEDFRSYSKGLRESGLVWDAATMDRWVADPREVVATNNMIFPGIRSDKDRRDLIVYLAVETAPY